MSVKVTDNQVSKANFGLDSFRAAVNYVNTKNKGYVRFEADGNGGVKIAKVNNKIDLKIGWRTNIDSVKNLAMRQKFANAIKNDLKWANGADVQKIVDKILKVKDGGVNRTDPLSRKEIEKIFGDYDRIMNSPLGRMKIVDSIISKAAENCGLGGGDEAVKAFKNKYLKLPEGFGDIYEMYETNENGAIGKPGYMKMDEMQFKGKLRLLESACNEALMKARVDRTLRVKAEPLVGKDAVGNDFGLHLTEKDKADFRGALHHFLTQKGILEAYDNGVDGIPGTKGMIFEKFVNDILPELFRKNIENIRAYGENADGNLHIEANFSFDAIVEEAETFIANASAYIKNPPKEEVNSTGDRKIDGIIGGLKQTVDGARQLAKNAQAKEVVLDLFKTTNISKAQGKEIADGMINGMAAYDAKGNLDTFAKNFLAERGIGEGVVQKELVHDALKNTIQNIVETGRNIKIAAKIQSGAGGTDPKTGLRVAKDEGMGAYVKNMESVINEIAAGKSGTDVQLVGKLLSFTLANIANRKVEKPANGIGVDLNLDKASQKTDEELLTRTAAAYTAFEKNVDKKIASELKAFEKLAKAQAKAGLIDQAQLNNMVALAKEKFGAAHKAAVEAFFLKSPCDDAETGKAMLDRVFKGKLSEARAELNNNLAVNSMGRTLGIREKGELMKVDDRINEALSQPGMDAELKKLGIPGVITQEEAMGTLRKGALRRIYSSVLAEKLKNVPKVDGHRTIDAKFVQGVKDAFNKKVMELVKNVAKFTTGKDGFVETAKEALRDHVTSLIDRDLAQFKGYKDGPQPITKEETKTVSSEMSLEIMRAMSPLMKDRILEILENPESVAKKNVPDMVDEFMGENGVDGLGMSRVRVAEDRCKMVNDFMNGDGFKNVKTIASTTGAFGKGGVLENVFTGSISEGQELADRAIKLVEARVRAKPLIYATGDKTFLANRLVADIDKIVQGYAAKWAGFRTKFLKEAAKVDAEFASLGKETLDQTLRWVMYQLATRDDFDKIDMKIAIGYYRNQLTETLNYSVDKKREQFDVYAKKVTAVHSETMKTIRDACDVIASQIDGTVTPEALEHFKNTIAPEFAKRMEYGIYVNPDDYSTEEKRDALYDKILNTFGEAVTDVMIDNSMTFGGYKRAMASCGGKVLLNDNAEIAAATKTIEGWLKTPEGHSMQAASEKALLDHLLDFHQDYKGRKTAMDFVPTAEGNDTAKFRAAIRDLLRGHTVQLLYTAFDNGKVEEAKTIFERWLDSHAIEKFGGYHGSKAREDIMKMFVERVNTLQNGALAGRENEPILTPAFIQQVDMKIDSAGAQALLSDWKAQQMEYWIGQLSQRDEWKVFNLADPGLSNLTPSQRTAVERNNQDLIDALSLALTSVGASTDGTAGIDGVKAALEKLDMDAIKAKINTDVVTVLEKGIRRFDRASGAYDEIQRYSHSIERALIRNILGAKADGRFTNGLVDIVEYAKNTKPEIAAKYPALENVVSNIKTEVAYQFAVQLNAAEENDCTLAQFTTMIDGFSRKFLSDIYDNKEVWSKVLKPVLTAIDKAI